MRQKPHFTDMSPPVSWCFSVCKMRFLLSTIKYSCKNTDKNIFIIKKIQYCIAPDQSQAFLPISVLHKIVSTSIPTHTKTIHFMPPTTAPAILLIPRMTGSLARRSMAYASTWIRIEESMYDTKKERQFTATLARYPEIYLQMY